MCAQDSTASVSCGTAFENAARGGYRLRQCLFEFFNATCAEKIHRRFLIRYTELISPILTVAHSKLTWTYGILPAICPARRYVQAAELRLPTVKRLLRAVVLAAYVRRRQSTFALPPQAGQVSVRESTDFLPAPGMRHSGARMYQKVATS
jgi:hypothetical protein